MINKPLTIGDIVWIYNNGFGLKIQQVKITSELMTQNDIKYYEFDSITSSGSFCAEIKHIFLTKKEAEEYALKLKNEKYKKMADNVNEVEDIIRLAYKHMFSDEYTNWEAIEVVRNKTKELLGIDLK